MRETVSERRQFPPPTSVIEFFDYLTSISSTVQFHISLVLLRRKCTDNKVVILATERIEHAAGVGKNAYDGRFKPHMNPAVVGSIRTAPNSTSSEADAPSSSPPENSAST